MIFGQLIFRWDISTIDALPDYMKFLYHAILDVFNEIEEQTAQEGRSHYVQYAKEAVRYFFPYLLIHFFNIINVCVYIYIYT